jgi:uncharacterized protein
MFLVKPGDHPEFFRFPAPEGRSRESTLRLDANGRFWHDGAVVEHAGLSKALHSWIARHPDDGRYILTNGYDWTYFTVDDAPYFVQSVKIEPDRVMLALSDGSEEAWKPADSRIGERDALYTRVKRGAPGGPFEAKFTAHAQASLEPALVEGDEGHAGSAPAVRLGSQVVRIGTGSALPGRQT